jgi:hypothetical protein
MGVHRSTYYRWKAKVDRQRQHAVMIHAMVAVMVWRYVEYARPHSASLPAPDGSKVSEAAAARGGSQWPMGSLTRIASTETAGTGSRRFGIRRNEPARALALPSVHRAGARSASTCMHPVSTPKNVNVAVMLVAAAAVLFIFVSSPNLFPPVPPGPIILAAAAGLVALARGRWTTVVGVFVPLFILIGGAITGTAIQLPALLSAIVAGGLGAPGHSAPTNPGPA